MNYKTNKLVKTRKRKNLQRYFEIQYSLPNFFLQRYFEISLPNFFLNVKCSYDFFGNMSVIRSHKYNMIFTTKVYKIPSYLRTDWIWRKKKSSSCGTFTRLFLTKRVALTEVACCIGWGFSGLPYLMQCQSPNTSEEVHHTHKRNCWI